MSFWVHRSSALWSRALLGFRLNLMNVWVQIRVSRDLLSSGPLALVDFRSIIRVSPLSISIFISNSNSISLSHLGRRWMHACCVSCCRPSNVNSNVRFFLSSALPRFPCASTQKEWTHFSLSLSLSLSLYIYIYIYMGFYHEVPQPFPRLWDLPQPSKTMRSTPTFQKGTEIYPSCWHGKIEVQCASTWSTRRRLTGTEASLAATSSDEEKKFLYWPISSAVSTGRLPRSPPLSTISPDLRRFWASSNWGDYLHDLLVAQHIPYLSRKRNFSIFSSTSGGATPRCNVHFAAAAHAGGDDQSFLK